MSNLFGKAKQKLKKKVGQAADLLRTPPREESRTASPAPSQGSAHPTALTPGTDPQSPAVTAVAALAQSPIAPISVAMLPSQLATAAEVVSSLPIESTPAVAPAYARPPSPTTILATTGSAVKGLLAAARDGSDLFLPLKAALVGIVALWDIFDRAVQAKAEFTKLESKLAAFKAIAETQQAEPRALDESLQTRLKSLAQAIQALWEVVQKKQSRGGFARGAQSSIDLADIKSLVDAISSLLEVFQFESSIAVEKRLGLLIEHLKRPEKVMKAIKSALGDNFVSEATDYEQPSDAGCMAGTRVDVLSKFVAWVKEDPMVIFWLAGMAGTGKTSIVVSLCRELRNDPAVCFAGAFFCSRSAGSIAQTDVRRIFPTLATQLADKFQAFALALAGELEKDRNLGHKPVVDQIEALLRRPLATLTSSSRPIVFVIDALDECSNARELAQLLRLLTDFERETKVKFILTSRPELHIRDTPISNPIHNTVLQLHTISVEEVTSDIRHYIASSLKEAAPEATWYTDRDIRALVALCGGLFIFASTVLLYVLDPDDDDERQNRLRKVTSSVTRSTAATAAIDRIYELVLVEVSRSDTMDSDDLDRMKRILACILTARTPLSIEAMAALIDIKSGSLRASLRRLHSLVHLPPDDKQLGLRTLHASFGDYIWDRAPQHLQIAATLGHDVLARGCLRRMAQVDLCFNVSRSQSSYEPNPDIVPDWIPVSLIYACLHWAHHIGAASDHGAFDEDIGRIFRPKFLFWLEVLSVLGKVGLASGLLRIAGSAVRLSIASDFVRDANVFVASSHAAISISAPHIYLSALPFAAKDSLVYRDFMRLCTGVVSVTTFGIDRHGSRLIATLTGHEGQISSVAYSSDGRLLASGSNDGTVRIWDTRTGEEAMRPLRSNDGQVSGIAFSQDDQHIVSGGEGHAVYLWNVTTGSAALPPLLGHVGWVRSVAISPYGDLIASASDDKTVRLWSAENGLEVSVMRGHTDRIHAVAFSPDGQLIASGSYDKTIRIWKSHTGENVGEPLTSLEDVVMCLCFSSDGKYLAAGSGFTGQIRLWNMGTRAPTSVVIHNHPPVASLAFSSDVSELFSAGLNRIRSWNPHTGRELPGSSFVGHSGWINSIALSPNGLFIASGGDDRTVRTWGTGSSADQEVQPQLAHSSSVTSVAVSSTGTFIVSGSEDHSICVWDASTGESKFLPLLKHSGHVLAVAISPDGCLIASASEDHTVRLWDAQTAKPAGYPLRDHEDVVDTVAFSPDGRWLASGSYDKTVRVWDVATRQVAAFGLLQCEHAVLVVAFSPVGGLIAAGDDAGFVHLWLSGSNQQARTPLEANSKSQHNGINTVCFSPDARQIVSGAQDRTVRVWEIGTGHQVFQLDLHMDWVRTVAYSPNGMYIASGSDDKVVFIWNASTGAAVAKLFGHTEWVRSIVFTPDGRSIISCGGDRTIRIWDVETALSLASQAERDPMARLGSSINADGWLMGSSGELLLWLPADYRSYTQLPPCSMLIGPHRVALSLNDVLNWGDQWTACWRNGTHPIERPFK